MLSTFGFTAVAFVTGSLALWAPTFLYRAAIFAGEKGPCVTASCDNSNSLYFGIVTCVSGFLGVASGVLVSRRLRKRTPRADPLVCAAGLLISAPFLYLAITVAQTSTVATYIFIFLGETFLSMNWAIVADILLYVVVPTRRSTAEAFQIVLSHCLGDAGSPYLIGVRDSVPVAVPAPCSSPDASCSLRVRDDEPIVVPRSGRSTKVPVSSVLI
ncbi:hypothetical protein CRUP_029411 [Coryphaenoides rupestris]|nr:hypothetical protein CRUP_029411 [Coryphaenoides rupestris]